MKCSTARSLNSTPLKPRILIFTPHHTLSWNQEATNFTDARLGQSWWGAQKAVAFQLQAENNVVGRNQQLFKE